MNKIELTAVINQPEYSFLQTNPKLNHHLCLLTVGGSHAYGTSTPDSDVDIRGIYSHPASDILSLTCDDKPIVNTETDTVLYPIKQIFSLLSNCNPNTLEILGTKDDHIIYINKIGSLLKENSNVFLSQIAANSFGGYATAQLRRLQNAVARDKLPQSEKEKHILDSIKHQEPHIERNYPYFNDKDVVMYLDASDKANFDKEIFIDINLKHYPLRDLRAISNEWANVLRDYDSLNHRNNKKDELHLNKHIMHIIRLLMMGCEVLEGKGINTYREHDLDVLMALRNGKFVEGDDYTGVFALIDMYEDNFKYAKKNTVLPVKPDYNKINELMIEINRIVLGG